MNRIKKIGVFCGSNLGNNKEFSNMAEELGKYFVQQQKTLVFGGGKIGLMGVISRTMIENQGSVMGIIPEFLQLQEMGYEHEIEMHIVADMTERKNQLIEISDAFIVLPGGIGTYEEVFEVLSRLQLRQIKKPIGFLNVNHFFDGVVELMRGIAEEGFIPNENMGLFVIDDKIESLMAKMYQHKIPEFNKRMKL